MAFTPKEWKNEEAGETPLSAEALKDLEERVTDYTDEEVGELATKSEVEAKQDSSTAATDTELAAEKSAREEADALRATKVELEAHTGDTTDAHDATAISYAGGTGMSATNVEAAIDELATEKANAADVATDSELSAHASDTTSVHGIADTSTLATKSEVEAKQDASTAATDTDLSNHASDTTSIHGITDTSKLVTDSDLETAAMGVVVHGSTASTARPSGFKVVTWIGSVEPENAAENDILVETE